jgi:hypothetical protein
MRSTELRQAVRSTLEKAAGYSKPAFEPCRWYRLYHYMSTTSPTATDDGVTTHIEAVDHIREWRREFATRSEPPPALTAAVKRAVLDGADCCCLLSWQASACGAIWSTITNDLGFALRESREFELILDEFRDAAREIDGRLRAFLRMLRILRPMFIFGSVTPIHPPVVEFCGDQDDGLESQCKRLPNAICLLVCSSPTMLAGFDVRGEVLRDPWHPPSILGPDDSSSSNYCDIVCIGSSLRIKAHDFVRTMYMKVASYELAYEPATEHQRMVALINDPRVRPLHVHMFLKEYYSPRPYNLPQAVVDAASLSVRWFALESLADMS